MITIIVLLLLAGISITMLTGQNGILTKAGEAKVETRAGNVEDKVGIRKTEWNSADILGEDIQSQADKKENELVDELLKSGDIEENEINRDAKTITIGNKVISYDMNTKLTNIFVALYSDGTLAFNNKNEFIPEEGNEVKKEYGNIKGKDYSENGSNVTIRPPWHDDSEEITSINFLNKIVPTSTASWFANINVSNIKNISNFDTSEVTDMSYMFYLGSAEILDIRGLNTSKVKNMKSMFSGSLYAHVNWKKILGLEDFNTSNVEDMSYMFSFNDGLEELNLESFDTKNVTNMSGMFERIWKRILHATYYSGFEKF